MIVLWLRGPRLALGDRTNKEANRNNFRYFADMIILHMLPTEYRRMFNRNHRSLEFVNYKVRDQFIDKHTLDSSEGHSGYLSRALNDLFFSYIHQNVYSGVPSKER